MTDEITFDTKKFTEFISKNQYKIIVVLMFLMAVAGMWFSWKAAYVKGAVTICENSGGTPILINAQNIKEGQCLIKYDPLSIYDNNLGLSPKEIEKFEGMIQDGRKSIEIKREAQRSY